MSNDSIGGYSGPKSREEGRKGPHDIPNAKSEIEAREYRGGLGAISDDQHVEVVIDGERRGVIRCRTEEEAEWIKERLSGERRRTPEERRNLG